MPNGVLRTGHAANTAQPPRCSSIAGMDDSSKQARNLYCSPGGPHAAAHAWRLGARRQEPGNRWVADVLGLNGVLRIAKQQLQQHGMWEGQKSTSGGCRRGGWSAVQRDGTGSVMQSTCKHSHASTCKQSVKHSPSAVSPCSPPFSTTAASRGNRPSSPQHPPGGVHRWAA